MLCGRPGHRGIHSVAPNAGDAKRPAGSGAAVESAEGGRLKEQGANYLIIPFAIFAEPTAAAIVPSRLTMKSLPRQLARALQKQAKKSANERRSRTRVREQFDFGNSNSRANQNFKNSRHPRAVRTAANPQASNPRSAAPIRDKGNTWIAQLPEDMRRLESSLRALRG